MKVSDILGSKGNAVTTIRPEAKISTVVRRLKLEGIGAMVVSEDAVQVVGILSERGARPDPAREHLWHVEDPDHRIAIVAHGGTNRAILSWLTGGGLATMYAYEQDTAALNIFDVDVVDHAIRRRYLRMLNYRPDDVLKAEDWRTTLERTFAQRKPD